MKKNEKISQAAITARRKKKAIIDDKKAVAALADKHEKLQLEIDALKALRGNTVLGEFKYIESAKTEAIAVALLSDLHLEESVDPRTVNGLNAYNLEIAERRVHNYFVNVVKLLKKEQQGATIKTLVLWLGGDFITGNIHTALLEATSLRPIEAILKAQELLEKGIRYILENTDVKLIIPTSAGNHGRITEKVHISTEYGNSLETYMYHMIAQHIKDERAQFVIDQGYMTYLEISGFTMALHHGHFVKYQGGVGGPTISINKAIAQWQKMRHADLYVQGHLHQMFDGGNFVMNGSVIGFSPYALSIKATPEPPAQQFFLIDVKRRRKTVTIPVFLD